MSTIICRDCTTSFERPVRRGRPPVVCDACKGKVATVLQFSKKNGETVDLKLETVDGIVWIENSEPCRDCGQTFLRPRKRGKPPVRCEDCKGKVDAAKAEEVTVSVETLAELFQGDPVLLKGTPGERPKGAEAQCPTSGKCGRIFTSNSACDDHKQWLPNGSYNCIDPATLGMEPRERREIPVWTRPTAPEGV